MIKVNYWLQEQIVLKLLSFYWLHHLQAMSVKQRLVVELLNSKLTVVCHNSSQNLFMFFHYCCVYFPLVVLFTIANQFINTSYW